MPPSGDQAANPYGTVTASTTVTRIAPRMQPMIGTPLFFDPHERQSSTKDVASAQIAATANTTANEIESHFGNATNAMVIGVTASSSAPDTITGHVPVGVGRERTGFCAGGCSVTGSA